MNKSDMSMGVYCFFSKTDNFVIDLREKIQSLF